MSLTLLVSIFQAIAIQDFLSAPRERLIRADLGEGEVTHDKLKKKVSDQSVIEEK